MKISAYVWVGAATALLGLVLTTPAGADAPRHQAARAAQGNANACQPGAQRAQLEPRVPARRCSSPVELNALLRSSFKGRVIIPRDANWEMKDPCGIRDELGRCAQATLTNIPLRSGVQLVGERGSLGSRPLLYTNDRGRAHTLFEVLGNDVRVEGLHLRGPANGDRNPKKLPHSVAGIVVWECPLAPSPSSFEEGSPCRGFTAQSPGQPLGRGVVIADNELDEWTVALAANGPGPLEPPDGYTGPRIRRQDAGQVRVQGNFFHHNARESLGYGVVVNQGAYVTIEGNVFDFNRHAVAADYQRFNGYIARFNYVLQGGFTYGSNGYYGAHFDAHGAGTPESRAKGHYDGGGAGDYYEIANNTIRGEQDYGGFLGIADKTRPAFGLRGKPDTGAQFNSNVVVHDDHGEAIRLKNGDDDSLDTGRPSTFNYSARGNRFDTDYSTEIAPGDFDGDGRTDVFVANGTAWFFSRGGVGPWEYLTSFAKRTGELGFADIDNDRVTDVLWRNSKGNVAYSKSGRGGLVPLSPPAPLPVEMKDVRFGDFDGDGLTDMFYTRSRQWNVWYGRTRAWARTQTSSKSISDLLFGEFDAVRGTDVVGINSNGWASSSAATGPWMRMNGRLTKSFDNAVAADFDGNGKTDIAVDEDTRWRFSRDGRSSLSVLRSGIPFVYPSLKKMLIGRFDPDTRAKVITFSLEPSSTRVVKLGNRFVIWRGLGSGNSVAVRSMHNMR